MSVCICPHVGIDGIYDSKQKKFVAGFLKGLAEDGNYAAANWSLLTLQDLFDRFGSFQIIEETVPFRGGACDRTRRCCGDCMRQCYNRCVQDCLHRLYLWKQTVEYTPEAERAKIPLAIRLIVNQKFESHQQLSWCVGEILSQKTNPELVKAMAHAGLNNHSHPYRNDYGPSIVLDEKTGKRLTNPITGEIKYRNWPETGLCPYCLPKVTIDGRKRKGAV